MESLLELIESLHRAGVSSLGTPLTRGGGGGGGVSYLKFKIGKNN